MRKVLEQLSQRLQAFLRQRDDLALVLRSPEGESPTVLAVLETLEEQSTSEMFWQFPEPFTTPPDYATAVVESFAAKHELVRVLQEQDGKKPWPALPPEVKDEARPPARRLRELLVFARSLLPAQEGALLVWVLFPATIADRAAYAALIADVLRHEYPFPWCHHIRFILRDDPAVPTLAETLANAPRLAWHEPDLSPAAMQKALDDEAADEALPLDERLQAVLLTANTDYAHKRYDQALDKYGVLLRYYSHAGNLTLTALVLNGMGEVHRAAGNKDEANTCFEAAMMPASDGPEPPVAVLINVMLNLGAMRVEQGRHAEAEAYYGGARELATRQRAHELKVWAMEQVGQAQYQQGKVPEALATWNDAAALAGKLEQPELGQGALGRLRDHYATARDGAQQREVEQRLAQLPGPAER